MQNTLGIVDVDRDVLGGSASAGRKVGGKSVLEWVVRLAPPIVSNWTESWWCFLTRSKAVAGAWTLRQTRRSATAHAPTP